jgi:hypothetical protein
MATGQKPDLSDLHKFGCIVWVKNLKAQKLDPRTIQGKFIGYDEESKGYRIYWPKKNSVTVERDVYFDKSEALRPEITQIEEEYVEKTNLHPSSPKVRKHPTPHPTPPAAPKEIEEDNKEDHHPEPPPHERLNRDNEPMEPEPDVR